MVIGNLCPLPTCYCQVQLCFSTLIDHILVCLSVYGMERSRPRLGRVRDSVRDRDRDRDRAKGRSRDMDRDKGKVEIWLWLWFVLE